MTYNQVTALMIAAVPLWFYGLATFVSWEANPAMWGSDGRFVIALVTIVVSIGVVSARENLRV